MISNQGTELPLLQKGKKAIGVNKKNPSEKEKPISLFHKYFSCSEHDHLPKLPSIPKRKEDREFWEANTYSYEFNFPIFLKSLAISIIDILGLKPLLFGYQFISKSKFLDNFYRIGMINHFMNYFGWINMVLVIYSLYQGAFIYSDAISLSYMVGLLFLSIIGASEMSFINSKIPPLLETVKLSDQSCKADSFGRVPIQNELKLTILRLNFDASSFFMSFIENTAALFVIFPRKIINKDSKDIFEENWLLGSRPQDQLYITQAWQTRRFIYERPDLEEKDDKLILNEQVEKSDLLSKAVTFEYAVFFYKFLTKPSPYDQKKAYGYRFARDILEAWSPTYPYALFLTGAGVIGTILVSFIKFGVSDWNSNVMKGSFLLVNGIVTGVILYLISEGTNMIWSRLCYLKGLTELISEEDPSGDSLFRKHCSMIDIFDFESLRTWASLRMIFMNVNQRRLEAISLAISIIVAIQLTTISALGLFYFTTQDEDQKTIFIQYLIFFGAPTIVYLVFVILFIYLGSQVNNQYKEHIYKLKTLKIAIYNLFALYSTFTGEHRIQPTNYLYAMGVRYLNKKYQGQSITQAFLAKKLEKINNAYDTIFAELEIEEQHHPMKLLGVPMTDSFAGTVFGTILTLIMIPVSHYVTNITGW